MSCGMQLLVLAAGMGSRFGGLKQMEGVGLCGEVLLEYSFYDAWKAGIDSVVVLLRKGMEELFEQRVAQRWRHRISISYAFQDSALPGSDPARAKPWGTGHAVLSARDQIQKPFLVINADDFYGREAFAQGVHLLNHAVVENRYGLVGFRLQQTLKGKLPVSRGICRVDSNGDLADVKECPYVDDREGSIVGGDSPANARPLNPDSWTSVNFWAFHPSIFTLLQSEFDQFLAIQLSSLTAEFYLPTAIANGIMAGKASVAVAGQDGEWMGMTYPEDRAWVMDEIRRLHEAGIYPADLAASD